MRHLRSTLVVLLALILFFVQSSAVLHAVVHPFHLGNQSDRAEQDHHAHHRHDDHNHSDEYEQEQAPSSDYEESLSCETFFAAERLTKQATLYTPPTIPLATSIRIHYDVSSLTIVTRQKTYPRARSPPFIFS